MAGKEYQMMFQIGAKLQGQSAFRSVQSNISALSREVQSLSKQQGDIAAYQKQQKAVDKTRERLKLLQEQYRILKEEMDKNGEASTSLKLKIAEKESKINSETRTLQDNESALRATGKALEQAGIDTGDLAGASQNLSSQLESLRAEQEANAQAADDMGQSMGEAASSMEQMIAAVGLTAALKTAYDLMEQCADASINFETGMAGVQRTVGGSQMYLNSLGDSFKEMSTVIPITTDSLTSIATTAGQLGIAQKDVESFTAVMAKLDTTTDLTADSAATMLAQFSNITGVTQYDRLGSVVADLGDATATTASKVVEMSQGMAAAAHLAGMSATDIMGISAAVGSLGVEAQAGSTSMSTLINTLYKAVETGEGLNDFASVANMTAEQFKKAWGEDAAGALDSFIQGLNDTERNGKSAIVILDELGINNVRQIKAILGLASAGNLLSNTIAQANTAWEQNTALTEKASVMYSTTSARLTMAQNAANNLKIAIGDALTPAIGAGAAGFTAFVQPIAVFIQKNPALIKALVAAGAVIGTVTLAITAYAAAAKIATAVNALFSASMTAAIGPIFAVTAIIAGLTAGAILLAEAFKDSQESMEELDSEFDDLNADFRKQSHIRSLCAEYKQLQQELYNTTAATSELTDLDNETVTVLVTAQMAEGFTKLGPDDFVDGTVITLTGQEDTQALLDAVQFLNGGADGAWIKLNAKQGDQLLSSKDLLNDLVNNEAVVELSGKALETVQASGFLIDSDGDGKGQVSLKALAEKIPSLDFVSDVKDGEVLISLTPGVANTLDQYQLLQDSEVLLSAQAQAKMVNADEFMIGKTVELNASAIGKLYAQGFLEGTDIVQLKGGINPEAKPLTADDFFSGSAQIVLDAERGENLLTAEDLFTGDAVIQLDGHARDKVEAAGFLVDENNTVPLKGAVAEWMLATKFFSGADNGIVSVPLTPGVASKLDQNNLLQGSTVLLSADAGTEKLSPDLLMAGQTVLLAAGVAENGTKEAKEFLSGENVVLLKGDVSEDGTITATQLVPESERKILISAVPDSNVPLTADSFYDGAKTVTIVGMPDAAKLMTVDDFLTAQAQQNKTIQLTANVSNLAEVQQAITALQSEADALKDKAATAKTDLTAAQTALADMEERQQNLHARLTYAGTPAAKSEIQSAIEAQSAAIEEQRSKVAELELAYSSSAAQYALTQAAADELTKKEQRLSEIKSELAEETNGVVSAMEKETAAIDAQIEKADRMAESEKTKLRSQILDNVTKQSKLYVQAVKDENQVMQNAASTYDLWNRTAEYTTMNAAELTDEYNKMLRALDAQASAPGFDLFGKDAQETIRNLEAISWLMGDMFTGLDKYTDGSFFDYWSSSTDDKTLLLQWAELTEAVAGYDGQLKSANDVQHAFINTLSDGVTSGVLSAEEAYSLLSMSLSSAGADAETVSAAMDELKSIMAGMTEETQGIADTTQASAAQVNAAIQPVLDKMTELGKAYSEAYDEAYKSMDGQFKLFEEAPKWADLPKQSIDDMISSLKLQQQYMLDYAENLKAAATMGVSDGLLAQLSDGSKESAAYLAAIVSDGATKIDELNTAFASVEEGKESFAETVAGMQTDFSSKMQQLSVELAQTISNMDMSADAAQAGADTVQAFADAADGKIGVVSAAFARVAAAAKAALSIFGVPDGYATGTENAERGFKMVGERGPELVWFNGGEKVMDAQETAAFQRENAIEAEPVNALPIGGGSAGPHIEVKPVYNLSGNMDTDEVRSILDEHTGRIREMVEDALDEIETDRKRSAYS